MSTDSSEHLLTNTAESTGTEKTTQTAKATKMTRKYWLTAQKKSEDTEFRAASEYVLQKMLGVQNSGLTRNFREFHTFGFGLCFRPQILSDHPKTHFKVRHFAGNPNLTSIRRVRNSGYPRNLLKVRSFGLLMILQYIPQKLIYQPRTVMSSPEFAENSNRPSKKS